MTSLLHQYTRVRQSIFLGLLAIIMYGSINTANAALLPRDVCDTTNPTQCHALIDLYNSTQGDQRNNNAGWGGTTSPCTRYGVGCDAGVVKALYLGNNNLQGSIPETISNLSGIHTLTLTSNRLARLPTSITTLSSITPGNLTVENNCLAQLSASQNSFITTKSSTSTRQTTQTGSQCITPIPLITYSRTDQTAFPVVATLTFDRAGAAIQNNGGSATYTFPSNNFFDFLWIFSGSSYTSTAIVSRIDTTPPAITTPTHNAVYLAATTLLFSDANFSGAVLSGVNTSFFSGKVANGTIFSGDGLFDLIVSDKAGNKTTARFSIDTQNPTLSGVINNGLYGTSMIITGYDVNLTSIILSGLDNTMIQTGTKTINLLTGAGKFVVTAKDSAGRDTSATFTINTIRPRVLSITNNQIFTGSVRILYTGYLLTGAELSGGQQGFFSGWITNGYILTGDGSYKITLTNNVGVKEIVSFSIDTVRPVLEGSGIVIVVNDLATYDIISSKSGSIKFQGTCGAGKVTRLGSGLNRVSYILPNGDYTGCVVMLTDTVGLQSDIFTIPRFIINQSTFTGVVQEIPIMCTIGIYSGGQCMLPPPIIYQYTPPAPSPTIIQYNPRKGDITGSPYMRETNEAYLRAYEYGITTMPTILLADMTGPLIRMHLAKMLVEYSTNILNRLPDASIVGCEFSDTKSVSTEMQHYMIKACQMGLMGLTSEGKPNKTFDPQGTITRAQFGTAMSRLLRGGANNLAAGEQEKYFTKHLEALRQQGIMTQISGDRPHSVEKRGYVMIMMQRTAVTMFGLK